MENKLKEPTSEIIAQLQAANIRTIMVTGKIEFDEYFFKFNFFIRG